MSRDNADHSTAASDQAAKVRSRNWSIATMVSVVLGLASAGVMTAAMFWIGDYYRGPRVSRDEQGRRKLEELQAAERNELQTYGWINRTDGVVRIPIDRAMQLLAAEARQQEPSRPTPTGDQPPTR